MINNAITDMTNDAFAKNNNAKEQSLSKREGLFHAIWFQQIY